MKAKALALFFLLIALLLPTRLSLAADLPEEAIALGGLKIGSSHAYVESIYGTPNNMDNSSTWNISPDRSPVQILFYDYGKLRISIRTDSDSVMIATAVTADIETPQGLHVGNTVADIEQAFGCLPEKLAGNGLPFTDIYRYEGTDASLVFYTNPEGTITEIHLMENLF